MAGEQRADRSTGLTISFVESLDHVVAPAIEFLNVDRGGRDLFRPDHIIVPNAGVRAWLLQKLASTLGRTEDHGDGIVANVDVGYLGMLRRIAGGPEERNDPWAIDPLTFAVLECLYSIPEAASLIERYNGPLRAARVIADRFDTYHARRPRMIDAWESGRAELAPELGSQRSDHEWDIVTPPLAPSDRWQFELWSRVRALIGQPSPPAQMTAMAESIRAGRLEPSVDSLLVLGLQSIPARMMDLLSAIASRIDVQVHLVHPSRALHDAWDESIIDLAGSHGILPLRPIDRVDSADVHPLLGSWLQGSREAQAVLRAGGAMSSFTTTSAPADESTILGYLQNCVRLNPAVPARASGFNVSDRSVQIHRAHDLSRQVEILRDVLLHAFNEIESLEPHEVVVLCPDMNSAAPLLSAAFDREFEVQKSSGEVVRVKVPLVVADRGLREVSDGARVLADLLSVVGSRASRSSLLALFSQRPVLASLGLGNDVIDTWSFVLERVGVQWGLDVSHRARVGVDPIVGKTYTWQTAIEQLLLGVLLPDSSTATAISDIVPLDDLDSADIPAITALVHLVKTVETLEESVAQRRTMSEWCVLVEDALIGLCGRGSVLAEPLKVLRDLNAASALVVAEGHRPFSFAEFAGLVTERVESMPGRQPLRTGAVTATSFVPLRSVPFRLVCVLGYDDAAVSATEFESDDLGQRQRFFGDSDPRIDSRRAFLDAFLAAGERFVVLCNGRSIRNNSPVPMITPLAEFVDMAVDAGIKHHKDDDVETWQIVHDHPRHAVSARNFVVDAIVPDSVFGHLRADRDSASIAGTEITPARLRIEPLVVEPDHDHSIKDLVDLVTEPSRFFLKTVGIPQWRDQAVADNAVLPFRATALQESIIWRERFRKGTGRGNVATDVFRGELTARGALPVGTLADDLLRNTDKTYGMMHDEACKWGAAGVNTDSGVLSYVEGDVSVRGEVEFSIADSRIVMFTRKPAESLNETAAIVLLLLELNDRHFDEAVLIGLGKPDDDGQPVVETRVLFWKNGMDKEAAAHKIEALVGLVDVARSLPMFDFGAAGNAARAGKGWADIAKSFRVFVNGDKFGNSHERTLFGDNPDPADAMADGGPVLAAWQALNSALAISNRASRADFEGVADGVSRSSAS